MPATWTYQVNLDKPQPVPISQEVTAGRVDRFQFILGHELKGADQHAFYHLRLHLFYDEDNKELASQDFTVLLAGMAERIASTSGGNSQWYRDCVKQLRQDIAPVRLWPIRYSLPDYFKED